MTTSPDSVVIVMSLESTMALDGRSGLTPSDLNSSDFAQLLQSRIVPPNY